MNYDQFEGYCNLIVLFRRNVDNFRKNCPESSLAYLQVLSYLLGADTLMSVMEVVLNVLQEEGVNTMSTFFWKGGVKTPLFESK